MSGLCDKTTEDSLRAYFGDCGTIRTVRVVHSSRGDHRIFAFVEFADEASLTAALACTAELDGAAVSIVRAKPGSEKPVWKTHPKTIHVNGFANDYKKITTQTLADTFKDYGPVGVVHIAAPKSGKPTGYALVEFDSTDCIDALLKLSKLSIEGVELTISPSRFSAKEMKQKQEERDLKIKERKPHFAALSSKPTTRHQRVDTRGGSKAKATADAKPSSPPRMKSKEELRALFYKN